MTQQIYNRLRDAAETLSGDLLGAEFGMSRAGIHKHIKKMQSLGISIVTQKNGYRFEKSDSLDAYTLAYELRLAGLSLGAEVHVVDSTSNFIKRNVSDNKQDYLVAAPVQTGGRGRLQRVFVSEEGGAYFSICHHPQGLTVFDSVRLVLIAGLAVEKTLSEYGISAKLKWPNDVFVGSRKICGILLESTLNCEWVEKLIVGIGINITNPTPAGMEDIMTSVLQETKEMPPTRAEMIAKATAHFFALLQVYRQEGFGHIRERYCKASMTIGKPVVIQSGDEKISGTATAISDEGFLIVEQEGSEQKIITGDIIGI